MRIAFDLDDTLIPGRIPFAVEPLPRGWWRRRLCIEPLRLGTVALFNELWDRKHEVWIYTTSFRSPRSVRRMFRGYGTRVARVINGDVHRHRISQLGERYKTCTKYPPAFQIQLLVDDCEGMQIESRRFGFEMLRIMPEDADWVHVVRNRLRLTSEEER